jgi:excisionase family DNA binding protein
VSGRRYFRTAVARHEPLDQPDDGQPLMTLDQASAYLQISVSAMYRLVRKDMPHRKVGGRLRFHRGELDAWTRRHRGSADGRELMRLIR